MKIIIAYFLILLSCFSACSQSKKAIAKEELTISNLYLSLSDAEKIMGQSATLTESSNENKAGIVESKCTYTADAPDSKTNKTGHIYYMFEEYGNAAAAEKVYTDILKLNEPHEGLSKLNYLGDQAFLHTDGENFVLIMARKGNKLLRIKVSKFTSTTSLDELLKISKNILG